MDYRVGLYVIKKRKGLAPAGNRNQLLHHTLATALCRLITNEHFVYIQMFAGWVVCTFNLRFVGVVCV